jgi:hypothetical protein
MKDEVPDGAVLPKKGAPDSANEPRLFDGETELSLIA